MLTKLDGPQLGAVLAHEAEHVRRRDPARSLAVRVASSAVFYVPLARFLAEKSLVSAELGADASAVKVSGRKTLVGALIQVLGEARPALGLATEMASLNSLDLRIETLRTEQLPRTQPTSVVLGLTIVALVGLFALLQWVPPKPNGVIHGSGLVPLSLHLLRFI
jgi:Zn-dependent protease with chaperone function